MINHAKALECRRRWRVMSRETLRLTLTRLVPPAGEGQDERGDREWRQSDRGRAALQRRQPAAVRGLHSQPRWGRLLQETPAEQVLLPHGRVWLVEPSGREVLPLVEALSPCSRDHCEIPLTKQSKIKLKKNKQKRWVPRMKKMEY